MKTGLMQLNSAGEIEKNDLGTVDNALYVKPDIRWEAVLQEFFI